MTIASPPPVAFIGCDVGKTSIVVFDSRTSRTTTLPNQADALAAFAGQLGHDCLVVCEATGGHEALLLDALAQAGCAAHRADARKVKAFIRSFGILGKTDAIDARALAVYAQERHQRLTRWQPTDTQRDALHALVLTRRDLVATRIAWNNRLIAPGADAAESFLQPLISCLDDQIKAIDTAIETLIKDHQPLSQAVKTLRQIPGIGATTAAALIALMPELGSLDRRQAAALAGLAPHPRQSGGTDAYRRIRGGRPEIKRVLFMAALSAAKHNQTLRTFYERLRANGKKPIVALTAVMRKLVIISNAMLRYLHQNIQTQVS
jgi:transposase